MEAEGNYPLVYANEAYLMSGGPALEAGCGPGRLLRYFHQFDREIFGFDYVEEPVRTLQGVDCTLKVFVAEVDQLPFEDGYFGCVFAFGIFHSLADGGHAGLREVARIMRPDGILCASWRSDNFSNWITDILKDNLRVNARQNDRQFHKLNLRRDEIDEMLRDVGFTVVKTVSATNMPFIFRFRIFRAADQKIFVESTARASGYKLNALGTNVQALLQRFAPNQFCNLYVAFAIRNPVRKS